MKNKNKILIIIIFFSFLGIFTFLYQNNNTNKNIIEISPPILKEKEDLFLINDLVSIKTILEINSEKYEVEIDKKISVYELMKKAEAENKIFFKEINYIGMGKFIQEINGIKTDGEKYWIYYVNNKKANIGVSNYKINPGDIVSWRYEENTY